jgi:hypothetical protein
MACTPCEADTAEVSETRDSFQRWLQDHFSEKPINTVDTLEVTSRPSESSPRQVEGCQDVTDACTRVKIESNQLFYNQAACQPYTSVPGVERSREQAELTLPLPQLGRLPGKNSKRNQTKAQKEAHKRYREKKRQSVSV